MSEIQFYPDELDWVNATRKRRGQDDKSFLGTFCEAALRADAQNYEIIRQGLLDLKRKYPADPQLLAQEERDRLEQ